MQRIQRLTGVVFVVILASFCFENVAGQACNWDAVSSCLSQLSRDPNERGKVILRRFIEAFESGIDNNCALLQGVVFPCVTNLTKDCRPNDGDSNPMKGMIQKMRASVDYLCAAKKRPKLVRNEQCMTTDLMKTGMGSCQAILDATTPVTCTVYASTIDCVDNLLNAQCPDIHHWLGHVLRSYVRDVLKLQCTNVAAHDSVNGHNHDSDDGDDDHNHDDHSHDKHGGATKMQLPVLTILTCILAAKLFSVSLP